jgi:hypothetical protein
VWQQRSTRNLCCYDRHDGSGIADQRTIAIFVIWEKDRPYRLRGQRSSDCSPPRLIARGIVRRALRYG